ncbi:hypothetical protein BH10PSE17_BH10PSE17_18970 [soil metagenome]
MSSIDRIAHLCCGAGHLAGACIALAAVCNSATAAEPTPWYAGVGVGLDNGRVDCLDEFKCDHTDKAIKVFGGYKVDPNTELQLTWFNAGHFNGGDVAPLGTHFGGEFGVTGWAFTYGYRYSFAPAWSVIGRGGLAINRASFDYTNPAYGSDKSKTTAQPYGSVGLGYALTPAITVGFDYDLTRFKAHKDTGLLQTFGLSAQYAF